MSLSKRKSYYSDMKAGITTSYSPSIWPNYYFFTGRFHSFTSRKKSLKQFDPEFPVRFTQQ